MRLVLWSMNILRPSASYYRSQPGGRSYDTMIRDICLFLPFFFLMSVGLLLL